MIVTTSGSRSRSDDLLSVVVLSRERPDLLRRTLRGILRQEGTALETIVVDNGSRDGTPEIVRREFPDVVLIALPENRGIHGRNLGFSRASGEIVVSLDDDIDLCDPCALKHIRELFERNERLGALTLKICEEETGTEYAPTHWWHPLPRSVFQDQSFSTDFINEAAVAFRRAVVEQVGGYYERLFWGGEYWDLVCGIVDAGYEVRYFPEPVMHLAPRGLLHLKADPRHALLVRNRCWLAFRRLPLGTALRFSIPRLALWGLRSVRHGYVGPYLRGLLDLVRSAPEIARDRKPISRSAYRYLRGLRARHRALLLAPPRPSLEDCTNPTARGFGREDAAS